MFPVVISAGIKDYKTIQFEWFLTDWCNYKCSYCSEQGNMSNKFTAGKYKLVLTRLNSIKSNFTVEIIGGEPTLHPNVLDILQALSDNQYCTRVEIVTNLSRPVEFYQQLNIPKVFVLASYHPEYHNEQFVQKLTQLPNARVTLNLSDNAEHWDKTEQMVKSLSESHIPFAFNILNPTGQYTPSYTDECYAKFGKYLTTNQHSLQVPYYFDNGTTEVLNESEIIKQGLDEFTNYQCTPIRYRITHDGDILNFCTDKVQPMMLSEDSLRQKQICSLPKCKCDALFVLFKEKL